VKGTSVSPCARAGTGKFFRSATRLVAAKPRRNVSLRLIWSGVI
jgi:hypothetical protein